MSYDRYRNSRERYEAGSRTFVRWIQTRPIESWAFMVAGFVIARILF